MALSNDVIYKTNSPNTDTVYQEYLAKVDTYLQSLETQIDTDHGAKDSAASDLQTKESSFKISSNALNGYKEQQQSPAVGDLTAVLDPIVDHKIPSKDIANPIKSDLKQNLTTAFSEEGAEERRVDQPEPETPLPISERVTNAINQTIDTALSDNKLTASTDTMQAQIADTQKDRGTAQDENNAAKQKAETLSGEIEVLSSQISELTIQHTNLDNDRTDKEQELAAPNLSKGQRSKLQKQLDKIVALIADNTAQLADATSKKERLEKEKANTDADVSNTEEALASISKKLNEQEYNLNLKLSLEDLRGHLTTEATVFLLSQPEGTFLQNLSDNLIAELTSSISALQGSTAELEKSIGKVFQDLFEQGSHGGTLSYSDSWQASADLNNFVTNLATFKDDMTTLLTDAKTTSLTSSQSISKANLSASEFSSQFRTLKPTVEQAEIHNQGDDAVRNRLVDLTHSASGEDCSHDPFASTVVTLETGSEVRQIDYAELNGVQCAAKVARIDKTITDDGFPSLDSTATLATSLKTEFDSQVAAITTDVGTLDTSAQAYSLSDYTYRKSDATVNADENAYTDVNTIVDTHTPQS